MSPSPYVPATEYMARWDASMGDTDHDLVRDHSECVTSGFWPECTQQAGPEPCPACGSPLREKWSGVECSSTTCSYWFCY